MALFLDHKRTRGGAQAFDTGLRDDNRLCDLDPAVVKPKGGHEVEGHSGFQHGGIPCAERHGAFAPVRRVGQADRIAAAAVFLEPAVAQGGVEGAGDVFAAVAWFGLF